MGLRRTVPALICLAAGLAACAQAPRKPDDGGPDIRSLEDAPATISPPPVSEAPPPPADAQQEAVENYRRFIELAPEHEASGLAQQRIADLQLDGGSGKAADSIVIYEQILREQPEAAGDGRILYQLARAYEADGQLERSHATLESYLRRHPEGDHAPEARFRIAEVLFSLQRYPEAAQYYAQHERHGEQSPFYEPALYKLAWCHYKQADYRAALAHFYRVLERHPQAYGPDSRTLDVSKLQRSEREIVQDSLRGAALSYAAQGDAKTVQPQLALLAGKSYELLVNEQLARHYLEKERYSDAALTLQGFAQRHPRHPQAAKMMGEAIEIYGRGDFPSQVVATKQAYVERFAEDPTVGGRAEEYRRDVARYRFSEAQRTQRDEDVQAAIRSYREVLARAPDNADSSEMRFQLAEQLYRSGQYAAAAQEYERVAYGPHAGKNGPAAAYGLALSWQHAAEKQPGEAAPGARRSFVGSALKLADRYPAHPEKAALLTRSAEELLQMKDLPQAATVARRALQASPPPPESLRHNAWSIVAAAEFQQAHYAEAERAYRELLRLSPANDPRRVDSTRGLAASLYRQGEARKKAGDLRAAADLFLRVGEAAPESDIRATADYDAGAALVAIKEWPRAIRVLEDFRRRFPQHPLQKDVSRKLAVAYSESGQKDKAAVEFGHISTSGDDAGLRQEAAWQAAELHAQAGQAKQAAAAYAKFVEQFPQAFERGIEARQRLIELDPRTARQWQRALVDADRAAGPRRTERSRYLASKAALALADAERTAFQRIALKAPLEQNLRAKKAQMEQALSAYARAAEYNVAEVTTAATWNIGDLYYALGRSLLDSPRPRGLNATELAQYNVLLEEQAYPFEEKAIGIHETNIGRATAGVYDAWVQRSYEALARLAPARFGKTERGDDLVQALR